MLETTGQPGLPGTGLPIPLGSPPRQRVGFWTVVRVSSWLALILVSSGCRHWSHWCAKTGRAQALYREAMEHEANGQSDAAVLCLQDALKSNPDDVEARWELAHCLLEVGQTEEAVRELRYLVEHHPDDSRAFVRLAEMLSEHERYEAAEQLVQLALQVDCGCPEALFLQGQLAERRGDQATALEVYYQLLMQHPEHLEARLRVADLHVQQGDLPAATAFLRESLVRGSWGREQEATLQRHLGRDYAWQGRWNDAAQALAVASQADVPSAEVLYELAYARYQAGDRSGCQQGLQQLLALNPQHSAGQALHAACQTAPGYRPATEILPASYPSQPLPAQGAAPRTRSRTSSIPRW